MVLCGVRVPHMVTGPGNDVELTPINKGNLVALCDIVDMLLHPLGMKLCKCLHLSSYAKDPRGVFSGGSNRRPPP